MIGTLSNNLFAFAGGWVGIVVMSMELAVNFGSQKKYNQYIIPFFSP